MSLPVVSLPENRAFLGVYDRWENSFRETNLDVEMDFISWENSKEISRFIEQSRHLGRVPMIAIEPFTTKSGDLVNVLLDTGNIVDGVALNDEIIQRNALAIKKHAPQVVLVRFAAEMELTGNYPWAYGNPSHYIAAYRHYRDVFDILEVNNVLWVWSPTGNKDAQAYYPGDEYVDFVGISVFGYGAWDMRYAQRSRSFDDIFSERLMHMGIYQKPIIIAELGVSGEEDKIREEQQKYKALWLRDALNSIGKYPSLRGLVYFNSINAQNAWAGETPDWRIHPSTLWTLEDMPKR